MLRLLFANWLPQLDKLAAERAPIAIRKPTVIYASDPTCARQRPAPSLPRTSTRRSVKRCSLSSSFARRINGPQGPAPWSGWAWEGDSALAREPRRRAVLIVKLAAELYRREQGKPPANAGALLGGYLKKLPEGIKQDDPIPAGID